MSTNEDITLIKGKFDPANAKDILLNLINYKINYHELKNFSLEERYGKKDQLSEQRIQELKNSRIQILKLIDHAVHNGHQLKINSVIKIEIE